MLPSLILPKKDDVDHQTMGFEMSENSMWDSIQKGSQIEVNSSVRLKHKPCDSGHAA